MVSGGTHLSYFHRCGQLGYVVRGGWVWAWINQ